MDISLLLNPNFIYILLVVGFSLAILALLSPGTGIVELAALLALGVAAWAIIANNIPINYWALGILLLSFIPFYLAVRKSGNLAYLIIAILAMVIGSAYLFKGQGWLPAVNPLLALVVSTLAAGFFWVVSTKSIEARKARPTHDLNALLGVFGEAKTDILQEGSVQVDGELWSAQSSQLIPRGSKVRVIGREGLILNVEQAQ